MPGLPDHLLQLQLRDLIVQTPPGFQRQGHFKEAERTPLVSIADASWLPDFSKRLCLGWDRVQTRKALLAVTPASDGTRAEHCPQLVS